MNRRGRMRRRGVLDAFTCPKSGEAADSADGWTENGRIVAVFAGGDDYSGANGSDPAPGRSAVDALCGWVEQDAGSLEDPVAVVGAMHRAVGEACRASAPDAASPGGVCASAALLDMQSRVVVYVGDVHIGVDGHFQRDQPQPQEIAAAARATLIRSIISAGGAAGDLASSDPGKRMILPLLEAARVWRNNDRHGYGYGCLDGTGTPLPLIGHIRWIEPGSEVVLATVGYPDPQPTLEQSEERAEALAGEDAGLMIGYWPQTCGINPGDAGYADRTFVKVRV